MAQMRAVLVIGGKGPLGNLYISDASKPSPSAGQLLIKIKAFGLNRMDISQREGNYPPPPGASDILGVEFSGVVEALGQGSNKFKIGDGVFGLVGGGAYAEYVAVHETHVWNKPEHLSWTEAASIPENWVTAFQALILVGQLKPGENVLIHAGASGVGVAANQLARHFKAKNVITTASSNTKLDWLKDMKEGPTHTVNYRTQNFAEEVKSITGGKGVDLVVDMVGKDHWEKNVDSMALDGRMVILSFLSGSTLNVNLGPVLYKRLRIQGSTLRSRSLEYQSDLLGRMGETVINDITGEGGEGPLRTYVHKVYPWTDIQAAHQEMEENKNSGAIVAEII